jgi:putative transposase
MLAPIRQKTRMPRRSRPTSAGVPQHVIQRGNNRGPCFFEPVDCQRYLLYLREFAGRAECSVHAYVLMTNHVHMLVTPARSGGISRMMQMLGRNYVAYVNRRIGRSGTLWDGRHKARLVDSEAYLLRAYRYIEQNPVRARMVTDPSEYPWSSYAANALGRCDPLVTPHACYLALGSTDDERQSNYRAIAAQRLAEPDLAEIRTYLR